MPKRTIHEPEVFPHDLDTTPVNVSRVWIGHNAKADGGAVCPSCDTLIKYRAYKIDSKLSRFLIMLYRLYPTGTTINIVQLLASTKQDMVRGREWTKLRHWGLIAAGGLGQSEKNTDVCALVQRGQDFVYKGLRIPKMLWTIDEQVVGVGEDTIIISESIGKKYDYHQLMNQTYVQEAG